VLFTDRYQSVKGLTHVAVAAISLLAVVEPGRLAEAPAARLRELRDRAEAAERELPRIVGEASLVATNRRLLAATVALIDEALAHGAPGDERLRAYGVATRPHLGANLAEASRVYLEALDAGVLEMERTVGPRAWADVVVVVATAHQARAREVSVQYFERLLGEHMGEGALGERRLIVTEGPLERAPPRTLVAAHLVDQRLSRLLFDDPYFLQSDVVGKVAAEHLDRLLRAHGH
jgi:hypothetical protein